ncbi:FxSxx-COOH system tetratricopeptide repeat protein [Streptomyces sp. WSLK1-3]|uniref:FxSxx-COOH system tetratricopeptide repeat protein n=1 Tax=Streptomyces sp. WSLK1-3 TaxID=3375475 RepID=UPI00378ECE87
MSPEEAVAKLRQRVDRARVTAGLTKTALAERTAQGQVKVSRTTVQQFFRADGPIPSMDTVTALATVLKLDVQDLFDLRDVAAGSADLADEGVLSKPVPESGGGPGSVLRDGPGLEPRLVGPIPPAALAFQHRAEADELRTILGGGGTAVLEGRSAGRTPAGGALVGLGGVGKSQLAADYARTVLAEGTVDVVVWVTATERSAIVDRLAQAGRELCGTGLKDPDQAARAFLAWLAPKRSAAPPRWLVVLDDLTLPEDMDGLWPPASPHGRTLVTTRRQDAALIGLSRNRLQVGLFTPEQAIAYLREALAAYERIESDEDLAALAADLGHLPLALSQAAAYLADTGSTIGAYRQALADRATVLHDLAPDLLPDQQTHAVAAAWALSIDHADTLKPEGLARPLLQLAACLDPYGIPATVLTSRPARTYLAHHRTRELPAESSIESAAKGEPVSAAEAERAFSALRRLSLLTYTPDTPATAVRVHQLLQHAVRDTLTPAQRYETAHAAADALFDAWPDIERDPRLAQALRANTTALTAHAEAELHRPQAHQVLYHSGHSLGRAGQVSSARNHFRRLVVSTSTHLGEDHPYTLAACSNLAQWRGEVGDVAGAVSAYTDVLEDMIRVLGEDHPHTLTTRSNLAGWQGTAGDAAGAASAYSDLLTAQIRVQGADHPDTLTTRGNLARWQGELGDAAGAATAFADLLQDMIRVLGEDHPHTLTTRSSLAKWQGAAGDAAGAACAYTDLLAARIRVLGEDHPHTLTTRSNLAKSRGEAGDATGAATAYTDVLEDMIRVLGEDHPVTLTTRNNLAYWRGEAGDAAGAAAAYAELLTARRRILSEDHPDTLITRVNLAGWRGEAGDAAGAAAAFGDVLQDMIRILGEDHPHTLTTRMNLAGWKGEAGDTAGAAAAFADLLQDMIRILGEDHPHTRTTRGSLAYWWRKGLEDDK